ncbi:MAG: hypothetical protein J7L47_08385 [Candidatus Odinarchaeota archaeon]|nr:hypothetical protein [Candidatus Odinarchaeota archaeon]
MRRKILDEYYVELDKVKMKVYDKDGNLLKTFDIFGVEKDVIAVMLKSWLVAHGRTNVNLEKLKEALIVEEKPKAERVRFIRARPGDELKGKPIPKIVEEKPEEVKPVDITSAVEEKISPKAEEVTVQQEEEKISITKKVPKKLPKDKVTVINLTMEPFPNQILDYLKALDIVVVSSFSKTAVHGAKTYVMEYSDYSFQLIFVSALAKEFSDLIIFGSELIVVIVDKVDDFEFVKAVFTSDLYADTRKYIAILSDDPAVIDSFKALQTNVFSHKNADRISEYVGELIADFALTASEA